MAAKQNSDTADKAKADAVAFDDAAGGALTKADPNTAPAPVQAATPPIRETSGGWIAFLGGAFGVLWVGGAAAYLTGYADLTTLTPAQLGGLAVFAVAPAMLFFLSGLLGREVARAGARARRLDAAVARLAAPAQQADSDAARLADAIGLQVDRVNQAMQGALARLAAMEEVIAHHADTLEDSSARAKDKARNLVDSLREERQKLGDVADGLDDKAALIAAAIQDQSKMVAAAAELAEAKALDGEKLILSGADRLAAAGKAAEEAGDRVALSLDARATELRDFSDRLRDRTEGLEAAYLKHRDRLGEASEVLRKEQEKIGAALDFHKAELKTMTSTARDGAEALKGAAKTSGEVFEKAVEEALDRATGLAKEITDQSDAAAKAQEAALARLQDAAKAARAAAEEAGSTFGNQADAAEAALERVSEAGFEAARRSDEAFQARLREAEELTERAAKVAETASDAVRQKLADTLESANADSKRIEQQLDEVRARMESAPNTAKASVEAIESVMREGLERLNESAEHASQQARDIDAQFQARIRQNYELLSDFILRMGGVAGGRRPIDLGVNEVPDPLGPRREGRIAAPADTSDARIDAEPEPDAAPASEPSSNPDAPASEAGEDDRPRREGGWRWRDLLATMDPDDPNAAQRPDKPDDDTKS